MRTCLLERNAQSTFQRHKALIATIMPKYCIKSDLSASCREVLSIIKKLAVEPYALNCDHQEISVEF
jgi:hypothetical protein